jgi:O-acetylserine/cysteine efflux transporter
MPLQHLAAALLVVVIWGLNFIFVSLALEECTPLLLCALRFLLAAIPGIFFIKRPKAPFRMVALYGLLMFACQFALLFSGLYIGMTPGMASLLMQTQVFFSIFFAALLLNETINLAQIIGALVAFSGMGVVAFHFDNNISLSGFLLIIASASVWGAGNLITKKISHVNMMSLVIWGSFVAFFPLAILSFIFEGPQSIADTWQHLTWVGGSSLLYIVYLATWIGYGLWNWLLTRYPVAVIAPFTLLVPVVGMISSVLFLNEPFYLWKLLAGLLVITGLCINLSGTRLLIRRLQPELG